MKKRNNMSKRVNPQAVLNFYTRMVKSNKTWPRYMQWIWSLAKYAGKGIVKTVAPQTLQWLWNKYLQANKKTWEEEAVDRWNAEAEEYRKQNSVKKTPEQQYQEMYKEWQLFWNTADSNKMPKAIVWWWTI